MAKIDEVKEYLTTLRVFFTVMIAVMVAIGNGIDKKLMMSYFGLDVHLK
ncbi:MAG: hypothetical protein WC141_04555 [Arcobacteraceae bacterium]